MMFKDAPKLSLIIAISYLVIFFALGSGLFNSILEGPGRSARTFIVPSRSVQTIGETIVTTMILFIEMVTGVFLLYKSGKVTSSKTQGGLLAAALLS